jgi:hypothetical protein
MKDVRISNEIHTAIDFKNRLDVFHSCGYWIRKNYTCRNCNYELTPGERMAVKILGFNHNLIFWEDSSKYKRMMELSRIKASL